MAKSTPATEVLRKAGIQFVLHEYDYVAGDGEIGLTAANALGVEENRLLKTLVVVIDDSLQLVLLSSDRRLDLKRLANAAKKKRARLADSVLAERVTGYVIGGISPLGTRKKLPTYIDSPAMGHERIIVNGGRRGLQIEIGSRELCELLGAKVAELGVHS